MSMDTVDGAQLVVNIGRLRETSAHIQAAVGTLESHLDDLERDAEPLVQTWSGEARQAYQERQATWRRASAELTTMLHGIRRAMDESITDYEATERYNTQLFR